MLNFKRIEIEDIEIFKKYMNSDAELSCESAFVNMLIWQNAYNNMAALEDGQLIIKSGAGDATVFRLPFGNDFEKGIEKIREYSGKQYPDFWVQEGLRLDEFTALFGDKYVLQENRDAFDYVYFRDNLALLSGKKYHGKRNHIAAFSKEFDWQYETLSQDNTDDIRICAERWYKENASREDKFLRCEKQGIETLLCNAARLSVKGGAIRVGREIVAFTLGSQINNEAFDIHIEKALEDYAAAYTVINCEFAKRELQGYKYINREDDMGLEGLRKAKLSYKPEILLKKYYCRPKQELLSSSVECCRIYEEAFDDRDTDFTDRLFRYCGSYLKTVSCGKETAAMLFALPCNIENDGNVLKAYYIFAAATLGKYRNRGYMRELITALKNETDRILFLMPCNGGLVEFYKKLGFREFGAVRNNPGELRALPEGNFATLAETEKEDVSDTPYTAMFYSDKEVNLENLYFPFTME